MWFIVHIIRHTVQYISNCYVYWQSGIYNFLILVFIFSKLNTNNNNLPTDLGSHLALEMDVADKSSVEAGVRSVVEALKAPPSLVANVAGITRDAPLLQMDERAFTDVIDVNLKVCICQVC